MLLTAFLPIILLTSAIIHSSGSLFKKVVVQLDNAVAEGEAFLLYGFADLTHAVRSHLEKRRARVYEDSLSHYMLL